MTTNGALRTETQFTVFLANKPTLLAQVCQQMAADKVNILAMCMMDSSEHGVLRLVAENADRARQSLTRVNVPITETKVLVNTLPNRPGALADVVERLASAHIAVNYAYCTAGAPGGRTIGIFRVSDMKKAERVLTERQARRKETPPAPRRPGGRGRA